MSPGATFERVYRAIREALGSGRYGAAEPLEPAALAAELNSSITPVRDALHRLVGEGLVEAPRNDGFRTPLVTELGLRNLYRWNSALLLLACRAPEAMRAGEALSSRIEAEALFAAIASLSGNPEHLAAILRLNHRLRPARRVEAMLIPGQQAELGEMADALESRALGALRRALSAYHRRRERLAPEIVASLQPPA